MKEETKKTIRLVFGLTLFCAAVAACMFLVFFGVAMVTDLLFGGGVDIHKEFNVALSFWMFGACVFVLAVLGFIGWVALVKAAGRLLDRSSIREETKDTVTSIVVLVAAMIASLGLIYTVDASLPFALVSFEGIAKVLFSKWIWVILSVVSYVVARELTFGFSTTKYTYVLKIEVYLVCVLSTALLALILMHSLGTHTENEDGPLPRPSMPEIVVDYVPSNEQKINYGLQTYLFFLIPSLMGCYAGLERIRLKPNENRKATVENEAEEV